MIVYTVTGKVGQAGYLDIANSGDITGKNIYVNMTNRCPCNCVFCLRQTKKMMEGNTLWLKGGEPSVDQVMDIFNAYDLSVINELIFCGYGEPLERLYDVCKVIDLLRAKYPKLKVRLNTNGLANLIHGKDVTPELEGRFDTVSISLNAPDADLVVLENVGNLICPAEFDTGAGKNVMLLSVPEGDDKPLKYPLMFTTSDVLIITKTDVMPYFDFDLARCKERAKKLNPRIEIFAVSSKTGDGMDAWEAWLSNAIDSWKH